MSDAAEVLDAIYSQIRTATQSLGWQGGVEALFGLAVCEQVDCSACGHATHQTRYVQYFYNTQVGLVRSLAFNVGTHCVLVGTPSGAEQRESSYPQYFYNTRAGLVHSLAFHVGTHRVFGW